MKAVIFDIDDTMISEYDYVMGGYHAVAERLSRDDDIPMTEDEVFEKLKELSKTSYKEVYNRFLDSLAIPRDEEKRGECPARGSVATALSWILLTRL